MQKSVNPFDQSVLGEFPLLSEPALLKKLSCSADAFLQWRRTSFSERAVLFLKLADVLEKNREDYARTISLEMGKTFQEARDEVKKCADGCRYYADMAESFLTDKPIQTEAAKSYIAYQPTGTLLAIMPWNFPFWQVFRFAAPALMAGNVGLLKHSSNVPQCSLLLEKIFLEAGFPEYVFQSLIISNDSVEQIIASDSIHGIALTGSEKAGSTVAAIAGKHIKKTVLELGGSDPFIVLPDTDIAKTAEVAVKSRMQNAGQSCIAAKRFIVHKDVEVKFLEAFKSQIEALRQGDQLNESSSMGPMARVDLAEELEKQLTNSVNAGAKLITGGKRKAANFQPTLLSAVKPGMPAFDEETFGPLAAITIAKDDEEAILLANRSRYGLGSSIWTKDLERGERMARQLEAGTVYINSLMRSDARLPFGGIKKSGYGRELSFPGIHEFVNIKSISVNEI